MKGQKFTVYLVICDDKERFRVGAFLSKSGRQVRQYTTAAEFLEDYHDGVAGCLVADLSMSGMSGLDLLKRLSDLQSSPPVVFLAGAGNVGKLVRAQVSGARAVLRKPVREKKLLSCLDDIAGDGADFAFDIQAKMLAPLPTGVGGTC